MDLHSDQASDSTRLRLVSCGSVGGWPHVVIVGAGFGGLTAAKGRRRVWSVSPFHELP